MALHAGFAVALSISESAMQQFLHAAYVNDLIPARYQGKRNQTNSTATPAFAYQLAFDLVASEPIVALAPNPNDRIQVELELFGPLTFSASGKPTQSCDVIVRATIGFPLLMDVDQKSKTARFGLDPSAVTISDVEPFSVKRTAGDDPKPVYDFDLATLKSAIWLAVLGLPRDAFLFTPPLLDQVLRLGYTLAPPQIKFLTNAITLGIDMSGKKKVGNVDVPILTLGTVGQLVDLNTVSTAKGWKKTFSDALSDGDDEYGEPLQKTDWTATSLRPAGSHATQLATCLHSLVLSEFWDRIGRYEVVKQFEDAKHDHVGNAIKHLQGHPTYSLPEDARIVINAIEATLANGYLQVDGEATRFGSPQITTTFHLKLRVVRTFVDGSTAFVVANQGLEGLTGEVLDVVIDQPGWITALEILGAIVGIALAPFTSGVSLLLMVFFELILSALVGSLIGNAENMLGSSIAANMPTEQATIRFTMPGTTGPTLVVRGNDVVVGTSGVSGWLNMTTEAVAANIHIKGGPNYHVPNYSWPVSNRKSIVVIFDDGDSLYNPKDTRVRIRWQLFGNSLANPLDEVDVPLLVGGMNLVNPTQYSIDHASDDWDPYDRFIIKCRVYRPFGDVTHELFQQSTTIAIEDRLYRNSPYVRWNHEVHYQDYSAKLGDKTRHALGWTSEGRVSKIHYTDPDKRCLFADDYSQDLDKDDLDYFDALPFAIADIEQHRKQICTYCFFGGPTKHVLK